VARLKQHGIAHDADLKAVIASHRAGARKLRQLGTALPAPSPT
jgi:hypothetical protein